ncbi:hypothetical protein HY224_00735 [Candidatus Uhrbacteria bacterium]|nr:hypothetical protein [Candidatus Uhrbacteria bacterium]
MSKVVGVTPEFEKQIKELHELAKKGGSGDNGGMDGWQTSVNTRLGTIESDIRTLWKASIAGFIILASLMGTSYVRIDDKLDAKFTAIQKDAFELKTSTAVIIQKLNDLKHK